MSEPGSSEELPTTTIAMPNTHSEANGGIPISRSDRIKRRIVAAGTAAALTGVMAYGTFEHSKDPSVQPLGSAHSQEAQVVGQEVGVRGVIPSEGIGASGPVVSESKSSAELVHDALKKIKGVQQIEESLNTNMGQTVKGTVDKSIENATQQAVAQLKSDISDQTRTSAIKDVSSGLVGNTLNTVKAVTSEEVKDVTQTLVKGLNKIIPDRAGTGEASDPTGMGMAQQRESIENPDQSGK